MEQYSNRIFGGLVALMGLVLIVVGVRAAGSPGDWGAGWLILGGLGLVVTGGAMAIAEAGEEGAWARPLRWFAGYLWTAFRGIFYVAVRIAFGFLR